MNTLNNNEMQRVKSKTSCIGKNYNGLIKKINTDKIS